MSHGAAPQVEAVRIERLGRAAVEAAGGRGAVAVVRGFNRDVRRRARLLRDELRGRDVPAFEVTPMTADGQLQPVAAVVDPTREGSPGAHRVAARLGVALVAPAAHEGPSTVRHHDVVGLRYRDWFDVAFDSVRVMPDGEAGGPLSVDSGSGALAVCGDVLIHLDGGRLRVAGQELDGEHLRVHGTAGYRVLRDGMPVAELHGDLEISVERRHYPVVLVGVRDTLTDTSG
jgi:hypothetical protein